MATKLCSKCGERKDHSAFYRRKDRNGALYSRCKECQKTRTNAHYRQNTAYYVRKAAVRKERNRKAARKLSKELRSRSPCPDCERTYPWYVMQFDHIRGEKHDNVANLVSAGRELHTIKTEIAKCQIVCANCHAIRTYLRAGGSEAERSP